MIPLEGVKDQRLVCLGDLDIRKSTSVCKVKFGDNSLHTQTWEFRIHFDIHGLIWLHADHKLVAWDILEDARGNIFELNANFRLLFIQGCIQLAMNCMKSYRDC